MEYFVLASISLFGFVYLVRRSRKKSRFKIEKFPKAWSGFLNENVRFYAKLNLAEKKAFEQRILHFLNTTEVVGYRNFRISDKDLLLVGASAVIPIFRFPEWEYDFLNEVILYPTAIEGGGPYKGQFINGLVGDGPMEGRMLLARDALYHGFSNKTDKKNVGVHEFAHIIDKQDGRIDGIPNVLMGDVEVGHWLELIKTTSRKIESREVKIRKYALTNDAEFLAVVTEYFFEYPELLAQKHPELYDTLSTMFKPTEKE